ncbi:related to conserved hypothetical Ustilaginaceae-specific protein [Ustilago sp. UG-2017a]|nr:related to conserved hypothetical Ustilaginaceae-specific protein [Ustilago sp. UG-2017a]
MRSFSLFLVLCIWVIGVIAAGDEASSSAAPAGRNLDFFTLKIARRPEIDPFLKKFKHLQEKDSQFQFPHIRRATSSTWTSTELSNNLKQNPNDRRFLFLGKEPGIPEMYLAVPVHSKAINGEIFWSLIHAHNHQPNTLVHHGYISTTGGDLIISKLKGAKYPETRAIESGDVFTIEELFDELRMMEAGLWHP